VTNWCMRATAYSAMDRGYDVVVVSDGHSTENLEPRAGKVILAKDIIDEFNSVMPWMSAPNVMGQSRGVDIFGANGRRVVALSAHKHDVVMPVTRFSSWMTSSFSQARRRTPSRRRRSLNMPSAPSRQERP